MDSERPQFSHLQFKNATKESLLKKIAVKMEYQQEVTLVKPSSTKPLQLSCSNQSVKDGLSAPRSIDRLLLEKHVQYLKLSGDKYCLNGAASKQRKCNKIKKPSKTSYVPVSCLNQKEKARSVCFPDNTTVTPGHHDTKIEVTKIYACNPNTNLPHTGLSSSTAIRISNGSIIVIPNNQHSVRTQAILKQKKCSTAKINTEGFCVTKKSTNDSINDIELQLRDCVRRFEEGTANKENTNDEFVEINHPYYQRGYLLCEPLNSMSSDIPPLFIDDVLDMEEEYNMLHNTPITNDLQVVNPSIDSGITHSSIDIDTSLCTYDLDSSNKFDDVNTYSPAKV